MRRTITAVTAALVLAGCADDGRPSPQATRLPTSQQQPYDGAAYAAQVQDAITQSFGVDRFAEACPQPAWVCAIERIDSDRPGYIEVTLQPDWEAVFGEWTGPLAGTGCPKWGEQVRRNITNFTNAAGVAPPVRHIRVVEPNGRNC